MSCGVALLASQLPWRSARALGVVLAFLLVTTLYICHLFAIPPLNFRLIFQFLSDVRPLRSPEYAAAIAFFALVLAAAVRFAPRVPRFTSRLHFLYAALAIGLVINLDGAIASDKRSAHRAIPEDGVPVDSAVLQSGFKVPGKARRHFVMINVEALGVPATSQEKALFAQTWDRPEWREKYHVTTGTNLYFGSTTNGELRELCGEWAHYTDFDFANADCLPQDMQSAGYRTTAIHSFVGELFGRREWYPQIGLRQDDVRTGTIRQGRT